MRFPLLPWLALLPLVYTRSTTGPNVLVVQANPSDTYSLFWDSLRHRGYQLTFRSTQENAPLLMEYDQPQFSHLILFAPAAKTLPNDLAPQALYHYIETGASVLLVVDSSISELWRDFAREFDLEFDDRETFVQDHFNHLPSLDDGTHTTLTLSPLHAPSPIISSPTRAAGSILYSGIAHSLGRLPLLLPILWASESAYSYEKRQSDQEVFVDGTAISLISAFQAKNNARITFCGSLSLFSDEFATAKIPSASGASELSGNVQFLKDLTRWTFQETGVLKVAKKEHYRALDGKTEKFYRVGDELVYNIEISEFDGQDWIPHTATTPQLEYFMLDPYLRIPLSPSPVSALNSTLFTTLFKSPTAHGVFTLKIDHRRAGYSNLEEKMVINVTPLRHDEFERFFVGGLPYYLGAGSVLGAFVLFVVGWSSL